MTFAKSLFLALATLASVPAFAAPRPATVKFDKVGTWERGQNGFDIQGNVSGTETVRADQITHLGLKDEYSFRVELADGRKLLVSNLDVKVPGEGTAKFQPIVYGYPKSAATIVSTAREQIAFRAHQDELRAKYEQADRK
jgi:hypothetical protein